LVELGVVVEAQPPPLLAFADLAALGVLRHRLGELREPEALMPRLHRVAPGQYRCVAHRLFPLDVCSDVARRLRGARGRGMPRRGPEDSPGPRFDANRKPGEEARAGYTGENFRSEASARKRDRQHEVLAHDFLAGDELLDATALLVEHDLGELAQRVARLVDGAPVRVDARQLLDESHVAVVRLEVYGGECDFSLLHGHLLGRTRSKVTLDRLPPYDENGISKCLSSCALNAPQHVALHSSSRCFFSATPFHASASGGGDLRSMMGGHLRASSAFFAMNACCASGTSSSAKIA